MSRNYHRYILFVCLLCLSIIVTSCYIHIEDGPRARYERAIQLSAPLAAGSTLAAETHNGSINVDGADVTECNLVATIVARAPTEEEAKELADKTEIRLEPSGAKLVTKTDKPRLKSNQSLTVSFDVQVPNRCNLELTCHNGAIEIAGITGTVTGKTYNGKVIASQVAGRIHLHTHNGGVTCSQISGDTQLKTYNGGVDVVYSETASPVCSVSVITYNGNIALTVPPNFSATVEVSTHNGSIRTDLPITTVGQVSKRKLTGKIGTGEGRDPASRESSLHLETYNGSVRIQ